MCNIKIVGNLLRITTLAHKPCPPSYTSSSISSESDLEVEDGSASTEECSGTNSASDHWHSASGRGSSGGICGLRAWAACRGRITDRSGWLWNARGERSLIAWSSAIKCARAFLIITIILSSCIGWVQNIVDDVNNTASNENIWSHDACVIHKHIIVVDSDSDIAALKSWDHSAIGQQSAVERTVRNHDVVLQNASQILGRQIGESGTNVPEGHVRRSEDCNILKTIDCVNEISFDQRTSERR